MNLSIVKAYFQKGLVCTLLLSTGIVIPRAHATIWVMDSILARSSGQALFKSTQGTAGSAVEQVISQLRTGDALVLPTSLPLGEVNITNPVSDIEVLGGFDGQINVKGNMRGWKFFHACANTGFYADETANLEGCSFKYSFSGKSFIDKSLGGTYQAVGLGLAAGPKGAALAKGAAVPKSYQPDVQFGLKKFYISNYGNKDTWMPIYYVDGAGAKTETDDAQAELQNATGGKWSFAIETNQGSRAVCLRLINCKRLQLYSGSSEGNKHQTGATYVMRNCEQSVLAMRRFFSNHQITSSWAGAPAIGLSIEGGSGNIIHNLVDIGNPLASSMVSEDPKLHIWQTFFEDKVQMSPGTFQFAVTHQGMINQQYTWTEPVQVDQEVILKAGSKDLLASGPGSALPVPPAFDLQEWMAGTAKTGSGAATSSLQKNFRNAQGFGSAFLAAGADPTGKQYSDEAFMKVMAMGAKVELPPGRFRISKSILAGVAGILPSDNPAVLSAGTGPRRIFGSGRGRTIILADEGVPSVLDLSYARVGLAKAMPVAGKDLAILDGVTLEGAQNGILLPNSGLSTVFTDFEIKGFAKAGVAYAASDIIVPVEGKPCGSDGNCADVHVYEDGELTGGDYGIYYTAFADKQGIRNVKFSGQKKAGIWAGNTNLFHGWVDQCTFTDIDGPGIDLSGGLFSERYGYLVPWVTMIDRCTFTNCGSATRAALDFGLTDINMLCNSKITGTKPIKYGFLGSVSQISNTTIDVNAAKAALALRHPRQTEASRTPATILHTVTCKGKMMFVNGIPNGVNASDDDPTKDFIYKARMADGATFSGNNHSGPKWWVKGQYDWAFTRLIYNSTINGKKYEYVLTNNAGFAKELKTMAAIDMSDVLMAGNLNSGQPSAFPVRGLQAVVPYGMQVWIHDFQGRRVRLLSGAQLADPGSLKNHVPQGVYFYKDSQGRNRSIALNGI